MKQVLGLSYSFVHRYFRGLLDAGNSDQFFILG